MDYLTILGWLAGPLATALIAWLGASLKASRARERRHDERKDAEHVALMTGMRVLLKDKLYDMHERYVVKGEPMPYEAKEREDEVYRAYHSLGGNGTGTHIHEELMAAYVGGRRDAD